MRTVCKKLDPHSWGRLLGMRKPVNISYSNGTETELGRLRAENAALRQQVAALEEADRHARQLCNLLSYTGRPQKDNLGGADDGGN